MIVNNDNESSTTYGSCGLKWTLWKEECPQYAVMEAFGASVAGYSLVHLHGVRQRSYAFANTGVLTTRYIEEKLGPCASTRELFDLSIALSRLLDRGVIDLDDLDLDDSIFAVENGGE